MNVWQKTLTRQQSVYAVKGFDSERWDQELGEDLAALGIADAFTLAKALNAFTLQKLETRQDAATTFKELTTVNPIEVIRNELQHNHRTPANRT